ncbi:MAG TPA: hemolysin family protein [Candidatus Angelobacter sp.]|jgi:putative hemolysin|nr:hemolysin family protein [Candidatus Angelobacter sp.]
MTLYVFLLVLSLIIAAFAAAAETSLSSVSRLRIRTLAEEGDKRARRVAALHAKPNQYLSTILTLNTAAVTVATTSATLIAFSQGAHVPEALITGLLTAFLLVFCEIAPKSLALRFNERIALTLAGPVATLTVILRPVVSVLTAVATLVVRTAARGQVPGPFVTEEELRMLVVMGEQQGVVEQEERQMMMGVLEMTDKAVREIMVPRVDVVAVEGGKTVREVIGLIIEHGHSRIPVYEETMDNVVGVVYAKDLLQHDDDAPDQSVKTLAREAYFTPESKKVGELLHDMQVRKIHIAIVVDEYGGTAGIVTMEDLFEEIVGPIRDEYDIAEQEEIQFLSDHEVLLSARVSVDDVGEMLHIDIPETDADSIGGYVYERLGEIPKPGATVAVGHARITVETVRRQSIRTVRITSDHPFTGEHPDGNREEGHDSEPREAHQ